MMPCKPLYGTVIYVGAVKQSRDASLSTFVRAFDYGIHSLTQFPQFSVCCIVADAIIIVLVTALKYPFRSKSLLLIVGFN